MGGSRQPPARRRTLEEWPSAQRLGAQHPSRADRPARSKEIPHYDPDEQIGFLLRRAHQRNTALFLNFIGASQLTTTQFAAMSRLYSHGTLSQSTLGRLAAMDPATMQGVVRRLIARRMITRIPDNEDRRRRLLRLTPAGMALMESLFEDALKVSEATMAPLKPSEQRTLMELLKRIS